MEKMLGKIEKNQEESKKIYEDAHTLDGYVWDCVR